jgi:hypothetical protein
MKKSIYAIAFVLSAGAGAAFGTSPYAAESAHGALTSLSGWRGCSQTTKTDPRCEVKSPRDAHTGMATGAKLSGGSKPTNVTKVRTKSNQANE